MTAVSPPLSNPAAPQKRKPFWRSWRAYFLLVVVLLVIFLSIAAFLATRTPDWYHPMDAHNPEVAMTGDHFQKYDWISDRTQLERAAFGHDETIVLKEEVLNAFLAVTFLPYENSDKAVSGPVVVFTPGHITIAGRVKGIPGIGSGVLSLSFHCEVSPPPTPTADPSTQFRLVLDTASIGALRLPCWLVRQRLTKALGDMGPTADAIIHSVRRKQDAPSQAGELRELFQHIAREEVVSLPYEYHSDAGMRPVFLHAIDLEDRQLKVSLSALPLQ